MDLLNDIEAHKESKILIAAFADPQSPCDAHSIGCITSHPDSWASTAVDRLQQNNLDLSDLPDSRIVDAVWSDVGGPVVIIEVPLSELLKHDIYDQEVHFGTTSLCASIEYDAPHTAIIVNGVAAGVVRNQIVAQFTAMSRGGGCNAASCLFVPSAKKFTKRLEVHRERAISIRFSEYLSVFRGRPKITEELIKKLFPHIDFSQNKLIEGFARRAKISSYSKGLFHKEC